MKPQDDETLIESLRSFHEDEEGLETLQVVLIVALAAIIFMVIRGYWNSVKTKADEKTKKVIDTGLVD